MTVVVSIVAGVFAIGSALPAANEHKVILAIAFVWLVTIANLRGTRESGVLFAVPTYGFVASIMILIGVGLAQCLNGCPATQPVEPIHNAATTASAIGLFVDPPGVLVGSDGADGGGGDRRRRAGVPTPPGAERRRDARDHGRARDHDVPRHLLARHAHRRDGGERRAIAPGTDRVRGVRRRTGVLRRAVLHRRDPHPGREHRVPGLPPPLIDPGARPVHAEPVHEPRRPTRVLERHRGARRGLVAPDLRLRCEPDPSHPAVRDRGVHLVHALADRHGVALATADTGPVRRRTDGVVPLRSTWSARR